MILVLVFGSGRLFICGRTKIRLAVRSDSCGLNKPSSAEADFVHVGTTAGAEVTGLVDWQAESIKVDATIAVKNVFLNILRP